MPAATQIGLDVGSTSVRAVEVTRIKDRPMISSFGQFPLPEGAVVGGVVKDDRAVTSALRQLWSGHTFKTKNVMLAVTHQQMVVRDVEIANLPVKEMKLALPFLVRDVLPLPPDQALLDFYPLEDPGKNETVVGLLIAAPKEPVMDMIRAVERAGLLVTDVDLACFAALRSAALVTEDTEAVIDIGADTTNFVIHMDGIPRIVRTIPRGGNDVTKTMATRLGMSIAEAEALKCRVGLVMGEGPDVAEVVEEGIRPLLTELRSSLTYFLSTHPNQPVNRLALVGGASLLPGLTERLTDNLGIPAYLSDPLQRLSDSRRGGRHDVLGRFRSSAAVSIGLTLGAA